MTSKFASYSNKEGKRRMEVSQQEFPHIYQDDDGQVIAVSPRPGLWFGECWECGEWRPLAAFSYDPDVGARDCLNAYPIDAANEPSIECQRCNEAAGAEK